MIQTERQVGAQSSRETRYYIASLVAEAKRFKQIIGLHMGYRKQSPLGP